MKKHKEALTAAVDKATLAVIESPKFQKDLTEYISEWVLDDPYEMFEKWKLWDRIELILRNSMTVGGKKL